MVGEPVPTRCEGGEIRTQRVTDHAGPAFQHHDDEARVARIEILHGRCPAQPDLGGCSGDERGEQRDITLTGGERGQALVDSTGTNDLHPVTCDSERLDDRDEGDTESAGR